MVLWDWELCFGDEAMTRGRSGIWNLDRLARILGHFCAIVGGGDTYVFSDVTIMVDDGFLYTTVTKLFGFLIDL